MRKYTRFIALLLAFMLVFPLMFASCGYRSKYDTVMEYNGIKLTEEFYNYWLSTYKRNILASYTDASNTEEFWNSKFDENRTVEEYFTELLNKEITNYLISQDLYKRYKLKLSSSEKKAIKKDINEKIEFYGGRGQLNSTLSDMMLNIDALEQIYLWEAKHDLVYDTLFGQGGPLEIDNEALVSYYEKNYSRIKYVVFYTTGIETDENGDYVYDDAGDLVSKPLTPEQLEAKNKKINEFKSKLESGTDFDTLIKDYSEYDTSSYPNGFFISENDLDIWGPEIFKAVKKGNVGDIVEVNEEEAIFYVQICELTPFGELSDADITQLTNLKFTEHATKEVYDNFYSELASKVKINKKVVSKYKLSKIKPNPHYSI